MLVQIRLGLEGEPAGHAGIRPLVRVRPDMLLKNTRFGACHLAIGAQVTALPGLGGGLGRLGLGGSRLGLASGFLRRLPAVLLSARVLSLGRLGRDDVVRRGLLSGLDDLRLRDLRGRHLLELLVQILWLAIVVVVVVVVVIVVGQLWVCHRHGVGLCEQHGTRRVKSLRVVGEKKECEVREIGWSCVGWWVIQVTQT